MLSLSLVGKLFLGSSLGFSAVLGFFFFFFALVGVVVEWGLVCLVVLAISWDFVWLLL